MASSENRRRGGRYCVTVCAGRMDAMTDDQRPATVRALVENDDGAVEVVRERNGEKQEDQRAGKGDPLLKGGSAGQAALTHPYDAPCCQRGERDQEPQEIEK